MELFEHKLLGDRHKVELIEKTVQLEFLSPNVIKILKELLTASSLKELFHIVGYSQSKVDVLLKEVMEKCFSTMFWTVRVLSQIQLPSNENVGDRSIANSADHESALELCHSFDDLWKILECCEKNLPNFSFFEAKINQLLECIVRTMKELKFNEANIIPLEAIGKLVTSYLENMHFKEPCKENANCEEIIQICLTYLDECEKPKFLNTILNHFLEPFLRHSTSAKRLIILEILWKKCWTSFHIDENVFLKQVKPFPFMLLVFVINFISEVDPDCFIIFKQEELLLVLKFGLVHEDLITRKQSQHTFKACLLLTKVVNHENSLDSFVMLALYDGWNEYFLCLELLEENQAHVVSPVIAKLDKFWLSANSQPSLLPWIFILYKRFFDHDHCTVCVWGINHLLKMKPIGSLEGQDWLWFFSICLLPALHDYQLYIQQCSEKELPLGTRVSNFLTSVLYALPSNEARKLVDCVVASLFREVNWEDVSLYHILASLTSVPNFHALNFEKARSIALASKPCWSSQEPLLREASQANLAKILLNQIMKTEITLEQLCSILGSVSSDLTFLKDQSLWSSLVDCISQVKKLPSFSSITKEVSIPKLGALKIILSIQGALMNGSYSKEEIISVLAEIVQTQNSVVDYTKVLCEVLLLLEHIEKFSELGRKAYVEVIDMCTKIFIGTEMEKFLEFVETNGNINTAITPPWLEIVEKLFMYFHMKDPSLAVSSAKKCLLSLSSRQQSFENDKQRDFQLALKSKSTLHVLQLISKVVYPYLDRSEKVLVLSILDAVLLQQVSGWLESEEPSFVDKYECGSVQETQGQLNGISKKEWRLQNESFTSLVWDCLATLCEQASICTAAAGVDSLADCGPRCLEVVLEWLPRVSRTSVASLYSLAETLALADLNHDAWQSLVLALFSYSEEYGNSSDLISSALTLMLQTSRVSDEAMPTVIQVCCELITKAQNTRGIAPLLARRFAVFISSAQLSKKNYDWSSVYESVLVPLLLFGPVPDKKLKALRAAATSISQQRHALQTCGELPQDDVVHWSPYHEAQETRCYATLVLLSLDSACAGDRAAAANIVKALRKRFNSANDGRGARDFSNSLPHRVKTRALQAVMVVLPLLSASQSGDVLKWVCHSTVNEQQQPSVRYLMEWMMALCVITWPELCPEFFELCRTGVKQRPGSVASFIAAVSLLACNVQDEAIVELCMSFAVPWCMAQQYNSRLYAQLAVSNIYKHCVKQNFKSTLHKFSALKDCFMIPGQGDVAPTDDFFFTVFDPVGHYSLQTIYYDLPRLSLLSDDEWMPSEKLSSVARNQSISLKTSLPLCSPAHHLLRVTQAAAWVTKAAKVGSGEALQLETCSSSMQSSGGDGEAASREGNLQRKVIPWSSLSKQQQQEALSSAAMRTNGSTRRHPLTVVGSLLSKATNLGGLCRTCEVLGAGLLVLPSMSLLQDQAFLGLSLASHKWIPLTEVGAGSVKAYLREQRRAGYCIVAVEQTAHSVSLSSFQFPAHSLLLLGNEREGLPCSLLREVDVCVEIPQFGVTRSLNAHVAGSLCVWQYVNQHSASSGIL